jgi:uncharacterized protein YfaP (DUF2135 family)
VKPVLTLAALLLAPALQAAELDKPVGGWNYGGLTDRSDDKAYAYPNPPIDRGAQKARSLIEGHLKAAGPRKAGTLIVNGNAMPLYAGDDGRYVRPYAFGGGSNSIEVRDADGAKRRVQFIEANRQRPQAQLRIVLGWDDSQAEVDMHVVTPDGQHAFWARPVLNGGGGLDVDSVDGPGPEMFTLAAPQRGIYHVFINYWGNFGAAGYHFDENTREQPVITARVSIIFHENTLQERRENFVIPLRKIGDLSLARSFRF